MSKTVRTAALVVGAVALVATGVGAAASVGLLGTVAAGSATAATLATVATVATVASFTAGALAVAATVTAKKPSSMSTGSPTQFTADPNAFIPYVVGRTGSAGNIVFRRGFDTADKGENDRQAFGVILSGCGPIGGVERFEVDRQVVGFNGQAATAAYAGFMWGSSLPGATPSPAIGFGDVVPPGWTTSHRLSGYAAATWQLRFDTKGKLYQNGVPAPLWVVQGVKVYDPRLDSTYPGGSGGCRALDEMTYVYSEDPYLHALTWVLGRWQNGKRIMGIGAPVAGIDIAAFVEGANVAAANGWKAGGVVYSGDGKWDTLKKILQAGMGEPMALGARISCFVNAPKVSLATIAIGDVVGDASVTATQPRRDRINTITPQYRLEENNWQMLPGGPVSVAAHIAEDGGQRSKEQAYPLIQTTDQVATAARYDIENAREFGPIVLPLKPVWIGFKPGDCLTADLPELGLNGQPILLLSRDLDPSTGVPTITARSETVEKHAFALGQTTTPPPTPGITGPLLVPVPTDGAWEIVGTEIVRGATTLPAIVISGATDSPVAESVVFEYRAIAGGQGAGDGWHGAGEEPPTVTGKVISGIRPGAAYEAAISYRRRGTVGDRRVLGPVNVGVLALDYDYVTGSNRPDDRATRNVFRGVHDTALAYSAGDEVTNADNSRSYVAKSAVPIGTALTNTAYWDLRLISGGGAAGEASVDVRLTNSVIAVPTEADGSGGNYAGLSCQIEVYDGTVRKDQTGTVGFVLVGAPSYASVNATGLVSIGDWGASTADLKVDTSYRGVTYRTTIRLIRTLAGAAGPAVTLVGGGAFSFTDGIATPAEQSITFRLGRQNTTGEAVWTTEPANIALIGDGDTRTLTVAALGELQQVTVRASVGSVYDEDIAIRTDRSTAEAGADVTKNSIAKDTYAVGGRGVEKLLYSVDINTTGLLDEALRQDDLVRIFDARTLIEGQAVGTSLLEFRNDQKTVNSALIADVKLMGARTPDGTAWNMALNSVYVGPGKTFSKHLQEVSAVIDGATVSVKFLQDAFIGDGQSYAKAILRAEADGVFGAFAVTADGITRKSTIALVASELIFVDNTKANATSPFRVVGGTVIATNFQADTITYGSLVQRFTEVGRQKLDLNGWYQEIPGGMTMMGGRVRQQISSETTFAITFPKPFKVQILSVGAMPYLNSFSNVRDLYLQNVGEPTLSGTVFGTQASTKNSQRLDGFDWWAWGN